MRTRPGAAARHRFLALLLALVWAWPAAAAPLSVVISGVDGEIEENIRASLDLVRHSNREDLSEAGIRRLYERARLQVREAMRPFGYYRPRIRTDLAQVEDGWRVTLDIDPRAPVLVTEIDVRLEGEGREEGALRDIIRQSPLAVGRRLQHQEHDRLRTRLMATARSLGYFDANFEQRLLEVEPAVLSARVVLHLQTGPRYRIGALTIDQDIIGDRLLSRVVTLREGEPYDAGRLLEMQYRLTDTLYFSNALVETGTPDPDTRTVPVRIETVPTRRQRIRLGVGYATDTELRGSVDVDWRRLNRAGHTARTSLNLSTRQTEFGARYRIPVGDPLKDRLLLRGKITREELADLESERSELGVSLVNTLGNGWQRNLFADLVHERTLTSGTETSSDNLLVPGVAYEKLAADDILFPRRGYRLRGELRGSHETLGTSDGFARLELEANRVVARGADWRFFLRSTLGIGLSDELEDLPASQRFFAGGDQSVRGYSFNALGPRDADGNVIGGRHLVFASVEAERLVWRRVALAAFVDAGNALEDFGDPVEVSAGLGVNVHTPIGTLRISVARSVTESRSPRFHISLRPDL